jgi:hypothetical protein
MISLQHNWRRRGHNCRRRGSVWKGVRGMGREVTQYIHVSKCKNDKINGEKKKKC